MKKFFVTFVTLLTRICCACFAYFSWFTRFGWFARLGGIRRITHIACFSLFFSQTALAVTPTLNVYIWADYIPESVFRQFEKETGITVNVSEYDSNETLYAKLKANPQIGFDLIFPSSYYMQKMVQENMLAPLDLQQIPNIKNMNPDLLNRPFDPNNHYSVPFIWGSTALLVNDLYIDPKTIHSWKQLWDPRFLNQLVLLDDVREVFAVALLVLGYSPNDTNPQHIDQAYQKLRALLPNIKLFNSDAVTSIYIDEDASIGMIWNGEMFNASHENSHLHYIFPDDGFVIWIDCAVMPKYAPHKENAEKFINFINRLEIAANISLYNGYSTPNMAAIQLLPAERRNNSVVNPSPEILKRSQVQLDIGDQLSVYQKYWQMLKLG